MNSPLDAPSHPRRRWLLLVIGGILLFGTAVYAAHLFTSQIAGANDFYPRWKGSQLYWLEGIDPYSDEAAEAIQLGIRGRLSRPDEDQLLFVYPFYTSFLLLPIVGLPYDWAQAIWLVVLQFGLAASVWLILRLLGWRMPLWLLALTLIWSLIFYNSARTVLLGQFAALILLWLVGCLLALKHGRDAWAGFLLALTTIKPQMSFLIILALLIWGLAQKRFRFLVAFVLAMLILTGASFLLLPGWLFSFIEQVAAYPAYTFTGSPIWVITGYYWPQLGRPVEVGLSIVLLLYLLTEWRELVKLPAHSPQFLAIIGLTLVVTNMVVVRTATTNYIIMYIPLFLLLKLFAARRPRWGHVWVGAFMLVSIAGSWLLFLSTIQGNVEHPINYLPLPFALLILLVWGRRAGWFAGYLGEP